MVMEAFLAKESHHHDACIDNAERRQNILSKQIEALYKIEFKSLYKLRDLNRLMYQSLSTVDIVIFINYLQLLMIWRQD